MARLIHTFAIVFAVIGCVSACDGPADRNTREPELRVVVSRGGRADTLLLDRFRTPEGFPLPFTTYLPTDLRARISDDESEEFVRFEPVDSARYSARSTFIHLFVHPTGTTSQRAQQVVETFAASRGVPVSESETARAPFSEEGLPPEAGSLVPPRFDWALLEVPYAYNCVIVAADCELGRIALGRRGDRFFHVVVQYPPAAAAFMRPRVAEIFRRWHWLEDR